MVDIDPRHPTNHGPHLHPEPSGLKPYEPLTGEDWKQVQELLQGPYAGGMTFFDLMKPLSQDVQTQTVSTEVKGSQTELDLPSIWSNANGSGQESVEDAVHMLGNAIFHHEAQAVIDKINKGDSQSVLDVYIGLRDADRKDVELYTDKDGNLKMRLTAEFVRESQEAERVKEAAEALQKQDLEALKKLLPLNKKEMEALIKILKALGWKVEEPGPIHSASFPSDTWSFTPPAGQSGNGSIRITHAWGTNVHGDVWDVRTDTTAAN